MIFIGMIYRAPIILVFHILMILSLEQLFSNIDNLYEHKFIFDCKLYSNNDSLFFYNSFINSFREIINKYSLHNNVYFESQKIQIF